MSPDVVINAGTCGGFHARGGKVGSIYLCDTFLFHDRRIPLPGFKEYGVGKIQTVGLCPAMVRAMGAAVGIVSSGNSLDMSPEDEKYITEHAATCKDMEVRKRRRRHRRRHRVPCQHGDACQHRRPTESPSLASTALSIAIISMNNTMNQIVAAISITVAVATNCFSF